jgi:hypothetical protein
MSARSVGWVVAIAVFGAVLGSGCSTLASVDILTSTLQIESGDAQSADVGTALAMPLVVVARDASGNPMAGVDVAFTVESGGGTLSSELTFTDAAGYAETTLTLGAMPGENTVTASASAIGGAGVTFTATGTGSLATVFFSTHVKPIVDTYCVGCHRYEAPAQFTELTSYTRVRFGVGFYGGAPLVVAGEPDSSLIIAKLGATGTMNPMLGPDAATRDANAAIVTDWITQGAYNTPVGPATRVVVIDGNDQSAAIASALAKPFAVRVMDDNDNPIKNVTVAFEVASGGGTLSAATALSDKNGVARSTLTVGTTAGANTVNASLTGLAPAMFTATTTAGAAAKISLVSGNNQTKTVGTAADPFVVAVTDAGDNPISGFTVTFAVATGLGSVSVATATTDAAGHAQTTLTLGTTAGPNTVTASATGLAGGPLTFTAMGTAGAATQLAIVSGNNQSAPVGTALAMPLVAGVADQYGNPVAGVAVTFAVASGGGSVSATSVMTNSTGQAASTLTVGPSAGTNTATASAAGLTGSPVTFMESGRWLTYEADVKPILVATCTGCHMAGGSAAFTPLTTYSEVRNGVSSVTSAALVVPGNPSSSYLVDKTKSTGTMYAYLGISTATRDVNAKTINDWVAQGAFNTAVIGPATQLAIASGNNQTATVSTALTSPLAVKVLDANGNPVSGVTVTFAVTGGGGTLSTTTTTTTTLGQAQTSLTVGALAGTNTVTASATGLASVTFTATGTAGAAAQMALVSGNNQSATVATALAAPLVVVVKDTNGNPVSGVTVAFAVITGGGSLSTTSTMTNAMGQAQSALTVGTTAGANTVRASVAGLTGSPVTFTATATAGAAAQLALDSGNNQSATVGTALAMPLVVATKDTNGNPVSGITVTFAVAMGGGSVSATTVVTNGQGQAQTALTVGTTAGPNTVTASATGLTPITFTATGTAGAATQFVAVSGNNQSATVSKALPMPFIVAVKDANGNPVAGTTVAFAVTSGGGTLSASSVTTNTAGQAQTSLTVGATAGTNTVTASVTGLTGSPITFTASGTTGTATQIAAVSGNNQSAIAGAAISPFVVVVKDVNGNAVAGFMVGFTVAAGGGTLSSASATTNALGQAQTTLTLGKTAGTNTVTANATGLTGSPVTFTATGTAGAATKLTIASGNNQTATVGTALAMPLVVTAADVNGNPVSGVAVTFAASGGGTLSATSVMTNAAGQAQSMLTVRATAGANNVTASATGLTSVTFNETARWVDFETDVQPILVARCVSCHMPGGPASFTPLTNFTQVRYGVSFFSSAPLVVPNTPGSSLLVQKTLSTGSMYNNLGPDTATRDANAKTISDWIAQGAFNSAVGAATQIVMTSGNSQSGPAGTVLAKPFVVTVMDAKLNVVSGFTVSFAVTAGGGTLSTTSVATNAQGTASSTLTLGATGGTNSVTASAAGLTNSPITFTATATGGYSGAPLAGSTNPFDVAALVALKASNVEPTPLSSDSEFFRRVTADLAGRLPTLAEWTAFSASTDPAKRDQAIDTLLASADFGKHWGLDNLAAWLCVDKSDSDVTATDIANFEAYLVDAATTDKPLSTVASELAQGLTAGGVAFDALNMKQYDRYMAADRLMETFTGIPSKCARCHDSKITGPLDDPQWTQAQNYGLYKFFETTSGEFTYYNKTLNKYVNPTMMFVVDGVSTNPTSLPAPTDPVAVRRARFAELLVASKAFARGTSHRVFAEVMAPLLDSNRVLAQQLKDVKVPDVLAASTKAFTDQGTSLKGYLRVLMRSKLYQLTAKGSSTANDNILARHTLRPHAAEVLEAGIVSVTGIADSTSQRDDFYSKFGYPMTRDLITDRTYALNAIQPLTLLNNPSSVAGKVTNTTSIIAGLVTKVDGGTMTLDAAITEIFRRALTRDPTTTELTNLKAELATAPTTKEKLEDVAAVVMASVEFVVR